MGKKKEKKWQFDFEPQVTSRLLSAGGPEAMEAYSGKGEYRDTVEVYDNDAVTQPLRLRNTTQAAWLRDLCQAIIDNGALPEAE